MAGIVDVLAHYLARGLVDFRGLEIVGTIPMTDRVLNELLGALLRPQGSNPQEPAAPHPEVSLNQLRHLVQRAQVEAQQGRVILHVELRVDDQPGQPR